MTAELIYAFLPSLPFHAVPLEVYQTQSPASRTPTRACLQNVDLSPLPSSTLPAPFLSPLSDALNHLLNPPPPPVLLARKPLAQAFAVLLMRTGYNAVDALDFVPMDRFQAQFFKIRSTEWEKFIQTNLGIRQGSITDPRYFDFISYAQMLTIQYFLRQPLAVFEERYSDDNGQLGTRIVRRDVQTLPEGRDVLAEWRRMVGNSVYQSMLDTVRCPQLVGDDGMEGICKGIAAIYDYMEVGGYCLKTLVETKHKKDKVVLRVEMVAPCILWGAKALRRRKSVPNDYDCFAVRAFCAESGTAATYSTLLSENSITRLWNIA